MKYVLVLQFTGSTADEFDALIDFEDELSLELDEIAEVDGHDFGSGEMNIFIRTDEPVVAFEKVKGTLESKSRFRGVKVAYRQVDSSDYKLLWPENSRQDFKIR